jgi:hypothetical protein
MSNGVRERRSNSLNGLNGSSPQEPPRADC